jgi:2-aminoadipate transaminase
MFIWVTLPGAVDATELLRRAVAAGVAFVPGAPFYAERPVPSTLRLCFATVPEEKVRAGIARLGRLLRDG